MFGSPLRFASTRLLDLLLPPRCARCGAGVGETGALCPECWSAIDFLSPPACSRCGYPFEFEIEGATLCAACSAAPPVFDRGQAVLRYDDGSRDMLLAFKHGDRTDLAPVFGRWLARAGADLLAGADLVSPVPLHWTRLFARRYNQAALLAQQTAAEAHRPFMPDVLCRRKRTPPQRLGRVARVRNVAGAFTVPVRRRVAVEGRRILLVDDVRTTGATLDACARALKAVGAERVDVLTLALVVRPQAVMPPRTRQAYR